MATQMQKPISTEAGERERYQKHIDRTNDLLIHAERLLKKKSLRGVDRLQASEKIWGAVTHTMKAIAADKGWVFDTTAGFNSMKRHLKQQTGDIAIDNLFGTVSHIHENFYQDYQTADELRSGIEAARELNGKLWEAAERIERGSPPPKDVEMLDEYGQRKRQELERVSRRSPRPRGSTPRALGERM